MPLTQEKELEFFSSAELVDLPVDANVRIWKGAYVGRNRSTGFLRPLTFGDEFMGVAYRTADNTYPGNTAGGIDVRLFQSIDIVDAVAGATQSDVGREVFAFDDGTLLLTPTGTTRIGRIVAIPSTGFARIRCQPVLQFDGAYENYPIKSLADATVTLTLDDLNRVLLISNTAARTLTLPPAATCRAGAWIRVVKTSAAAFAVTLDGNAAETIDGAATLATVDAIYDCAHLLCTGTDWIVLARDIA